MISRFLLCLLLVPALAQSQPAAPSFWSLAQKPPMGWNSWDCFGTTVTEAATKANADYMAARLAPFGWQYITVDIQWYEPNGTGFTYPSTPQSNIDDYGRLWPATNKHPSAVNGLGFKPLADYVHGKGLKFGVHLMRGIPRLAWTRNTPILGTAWHARDIANTNSTCSWNPDMFGVDTSKPGAQEYYNSVFQLLAQWGVDFVKVDDLSRPYQTAEIEAIRAAIDSSGRPMVLSMSPGETPLSQGAHALRNANQWRVSDDFWDTWSTLYEQFKRFHDWTPYRAPGYWPDGDMLPLGNIRTMQSDNWTRFTTNEQRTLMTTWCMTRSPLIMGGHMPNNDAFTLSLLTNAEVLAVNQNSANNHQLFRTNDAIAWVADVPGSPSKYVALINAADAGFQSSNAVFDSGIISRGTPGRSTNVSVSIAGATRLYLVVTDAGDYYGWDHADWALARLERADGTSNRLGNLTWTSATSGWGSPRVNASVDGNAIKINGTTHAYGIGTHAMSVIEYILPAGYVRFRAIAGLDDEILSTVPAAATNATIRFLVFTNTPDTRTMVVDFASLGIHEPVLVRDLWLQQDLGLYTNSFARAVPSHASALFKFTPLSSISNTSAPQRVQASVSGNHVTLLWNAVSNAASYAIRRSERSGGPFETIATGVTTTQFTNSGLRNGPWFYTVSARFPTNESAVSAEAGMYVEPVWSAQDIGVVQYAGNAVLENGAFKVAGSGADIWGTADAFHFLSTAMTGDATLTARIVFQSAADSWAKAGLMIRESTNSGSAHCMLILSPSALSCQYRAITGGASVSSSNISNIPSPCWLRLERRDSTFSAFYSMDGSAWNPVATDIRISMNDAVLGGLAVTAHAASDLSTAFFDNYSIRNAAPPAAPSDLMASALSETQVLLTWNDNATDETGFSIERLAPGAWEVIGTGLPGTTNHLDESMTPSTPATYRVRAQKAGAWSEYSPVASTTTPAGVGDGIPGWWRLQHFGDGLSDTGDAAAGADPDHDGVPNMAEYVAGTDPLDSSSVFHIQAGRNPDGDLNLTWSVQTGRVYRLECKSSLDQTNWDTVADNLTGAGGAVFQTNVPPPPSLQRFYRLTARMM